MLEAKKSIPAVATASLVLGGGCGDDGASVGSIVRDGCRGLERCDPAYFAEEFTSQADCRRYYEEVLDGYVEYYSTEYGPDCVDALLEYYACHAEEYARTCSYDAAYSRCESLYGVAEVRCGF